MEYEIDYFLKLFNYQNSNIYNCVLHAANLEKYDKKECK